MRNILSCAAMLFLFNGCVTVPEGSHASLSTSRAFDAGFDRVWGVLVSEISSFAVIEAIDKTSGLITTGPLKVGSGLMSEMVLKEYAHRPTYILGTWDAGRVVLSILAKSQGSSSPDRFRLASIETDFVPVHFWIANCKGRLVVLAIITTMHA
jgi:hypothetical protein